MPYNKINYLQKVVAVNEIFIKYAAKGLSNEYIYNNYIKSVFFISRTTFYNYLSIPYKKELKQIETQNHLINSNDI